MARRIIATAEVQVAADVGQVEAGLNGLTESFRTLGRNAVRAAERTEAAFFGTARSVKGGYGQIINASEDLLDKMRQTDTKAKLMAESFDEVVATVRKLSNQDMDAKAVAALRVFKEIAAAAEAVDRGLHDATRTVARLEAEAKAVEDAIRDAALRAERLGEAFRDVGRDIDVAMAGGMEGLQDDIRDTIRRLDDMGDKYREVGLIGERALDGIGENADEDIREAEQALLRLQRQLNDVRATGDRALEPLADDARDAARALRQTADAAQRADRSIDGIGGVSRRVAGDVRGLIYLLGATGLGYAAQSATRFGLEMTIQLEKSEAMFLGLTGSIEGASDMLERMVTFARETPYNLANVTDAAAQLLAVGDGFGVTTSNIEDYLTSFGNAITMTGGGDEQFTRLVRVFGQMSSSGKVLGQDMNQLAQNLPGYNVWQALADGANTSVEELRRLQNIGQLDELLTGDEAVQILIEGMEEIPGAAGAMERRMDTLGGAIEKFKETAQLATSEGLDPFAETLSDTLNDPVILDSVEGLANSFGALMSSGLEAIAPELDDLAAAGETLMIALQDLAPAAGHVTDMLGDLMAFAAPFVSAFGQAVDAVLNFEDGIGKLALAFGAFALGGPIGIAAGVLLGVSGAIDVFAGASEQAADLARLLAAAQTEVNEAMGDGEEEALSEAQRLALDTADMLIEKYPNLAAAMAEAGLSVNDLRTGMLEMKEGADLTVPALQALLDGTVGPDGLESLNDWSARTGVIVELEAYREALELSTQTVEEEAAKQRDVLGLAGLDEIAEYEKRQASAAAHAEAMKGYSEARVEAAQEALDAAAAISNEWGELDEERTEDMRTLLQEQVDAYIEWEDGINDSTSGAALSVSSLASDVENDVDAMIEAMNSNAIATAQWKGNIVKAAHTLSTQFGVSEEDAKTFMGTLGDIGSEFAPGLQAMLDDAEVGGTQLQDFFNAAAIDAATAETDMTASFDEMAGGIPTLTEELAEGTLTIDELLAEIPKLMTAAGVDFEAAAADIDASDEMGQVGRDAVDGLVNALEAGAGRVHAAAARLAAAAERGTRQGLEIASPSRVMFDLGEFAVEGLVRGIQSMSDEAYASGRMAAKMLTSGLVHHFRDEDDPYEAARKFAENVADTIVDELLAEREAVADAAEALVDAAVDRMDEAWDRVKDRFKTRDIKEAISEAKAELAEAEADLRSAESLAGANGRNALGAAQRRVAQAETLLARAEAADERADLAADRTLTAFKRQTEDATSALQGRQEDQVAAVEARIAAATRNLDPVARSRAEAELEAMKERHEAERTALDRRREDQQTTLRLRLDNENKVREAAIKSKQDELKAFEKGMDDIAKSIADAIKSIPGLRTDIADGRRGVQDAFFKQFEKMLENADYVNKEALFDTGAKAGLSRDEVQELYASTRGVNIAGRNAERAAAGVGDLLNILSSGLYTVGANGALGIAAGINSEARSIAVAMQASVQAAVSAALRALDINSPSKVTERLIGEPMGQGIAEGLRKSVPNVSYAMAGLLDNVTNARQLPSTSQLVDSEVGGGTGRFGGPLVTMPGAVIQDATDADLVAQRLVVALSATGIN